MPQKAMKALLILSLAVPMWTLSGCQAAKDQLKMNPVVEECRDIPKQEGKQACIKLEVKDKPAVEAEVK